MAAVQRSPCVRCGAFDSSPARHTVNQCNKNIDGWDSTDAAILGNWIARIAQAKGVGIVVSKKNPADVAAIFGDGIQILGIAEVFTGKQIASNITSKAAKRDNHQKGLQALARTGIHAYDPAEAVEGNQVKEILRFMVSLWIHRRHFQAHGLFHSPSLELSMSDQVALFAFIHSGKRIFKNMVKDRMGELDVYYVYILFDPTKLNKKRNSFKRFISSIFYIGKGTGSRIIEHSKESVTNYDYGPYAGSRKLGYHRYLWSEDQAVGTGVVFAVPSVVAFNLEHTMISVCGLLELGNKNVGSDGGIDDVVLPDARDDLGIYALFKLYKKYKFARKPKFHTVSLADARKP